MSKADKQLRKYQQRFIDAHAEGHEATMRCNEENDWDERYGEGNIADFFRTHLGRLPKRAKELRALPVQSICGQACADAIYGAALLIARYREARGGGSATQRSLVDIAEDTVLVLYFG